MATVTGILVKTAEGERTYPSGRTWDTDGWGNYIIFDEQGQKVALRQNASVQEIEMVYEEE